MSIHETDPNAKYYSMDWPAFSQSIRTEFAPILYNSAALSELFFPDDNLLTKDILQSVLGEFSLARVLKPFQVKPINVNAHIEKEIRHRLGDQATIFSLVGILRDLDKDILECALLSGYKNPEASGLGDLLLIAAKEGNSLFCKTLLDLGANVNQTDKIDRATPLHLACANGHLDTCERLLESQFIQVNMLDNEQRTPLFNAAWNSHIKVCELLIGNTNVNRNMFNKDQISPLHIAAIDGNLELCKLLLLAPGLHVNTASLSKWSALQYAARAGHLEICKVLVAGGADIQARNRNGSSVSNLAKYSGSTPTYDYLRMLRKGKPAETK